MSKKRSDPSSEEIDYLKQLIDGIIDPEVYHLGSGDHSIRRIDKRINMYGGTGVVYLLQMFDENELVNNRIGAYMILPSGDDSCGFHTHGTRHEQEIYLVVNGQGEYLEKSTWESEIKTYPITKGNLTTVRGDAFHAVKNTGDDPLVVFVITTNEKN